MVKPKYVAYLDSFRGLLCLFILTYHWPMPKMSIPFGWEGLQAFFVMSAYLIVRILLYDKTKFFYFKDYFTRYFYRRSFRIFPLYFAFIFFWFAIHQIAVFINSAFLAQQTEEVGRNFGFLMTYTYNFMGFANHFRELEFLGSGIFTHLWSLSLEEQFYIAAPLAVFFMKRKHLIYLCLAIIIISPILRFGGYWWLESINSDKSWIAINLYRMTPFQLDSFAFGALLALTGFKRIKKPILVTLSFLALIVGVYLFTRWYAVAFQGTSFQEIIMNKNSKTIELWLIHNHQNVYLVTMINLAAALIVMCFERGHGLLPRLFSNKLLLYFGKISYGIYVYHLPVLLFSLIFYTITVPKWVYKKYPFAYEFTAWFIFMSITLALAHFSYKYYESYFLRWKAKLDKIKYDKLRGVK